MTLPTFDPELVAAAQTRGLVLMVGAGVSSAPPSRLPGWKPLNRAIADALRVRLNETLNRPEWLDQRTARLDEQRQADRFPPEYQAQLIAEMCGDHYFRGLASLDVDARNPAHDGIAALAAAGVVRAVLTTNFDRLIEQAFEARQVKHLVAHDDAGFIQMREHLAGVRALDGVVPVIKIHGCVRDHRSMIDTLKQRKLGRGPALGACLDGLHDLRWLYLGFSAADLEGDSRYLGLIAGAERGAGATYVQYPGNPPRTDATLGVGARLLMEAYGSRGCAVVAFASDLLARLCEALDVPGPLAAAPSGGPDGEAQFRAQLASWAATLTPASAGLCLGALFEASGDAEGAARICDRLVRHEVVRAERDSDEFRALQLHYGRIGAAFGRFSAVRDLNGAESNASAESLQSLTRLTKSKLAFVANAWLAPALLWRGFGNDATRLASTIMKGFIAEEWGEPAPRTDEEAVDAWIAAASVLVVNDHGMTMSVLQATAPAALALASRCGDAIRAARVAAWQIFAHSQSKSDVPAMVAAAPEFAEAERVGDGLALGFREMAVGRWLVGAGGLALGGSRADGRATAERALTHLRAAVDIFGRQGLHPWVVYALIQQVKAHADLHEFDEAESLIEQVTSSLDRFPVWSSHIWEVGAQLCLMVGDREKAAQQFERAIQTADQTGLWRRQERLSLEAHIYGLGTPLVDT